MNFVLFVTVTTSPPGANSESPTKKIDACSPLGFCVDYDSAPKDFDGSLQPLS
jgi:hypothetical protein